MTELRVQASTQTPFDELTTKHKDPNYAVVRGHVPKELAMRFKRFCLEEELDYSEGLEKVLTIFFQTQDGSPSLTTSKGD